MYGSTDRLRRVNRLMNEADSLYHQAARMLGVSDSAMCILYELYERGDGCLLCDICAESGIRKQTINSALRKLERDGIVCPERGSGKNKRIHLTPSGQELLLRTAARVYEAECNVFRDWP